MKRGILFLLILFFSVSLSFSQKEERRVYYLDITHSMKELNLWNSVRDKLKNTIDNIEDERTEIIIVPFSHNSFPLECCSKYAADQGKKELKKFIDDLSTVDKTWGTDIYVAFADFYNNRISRDKINYFFLLTDGCQHQDRWQKYDEMLDLWESKLGYNNIYGFHIMLNEKEPKFNYKDGDEIKRKLWALKTMDVNINLVRFEDEAIFNLRNKDKYVDFVFMSGKLSKSEITISAKDDYYTIERYEVKDDKLRVYIKAKKGLDIPKSHDLTLNVKLKKQSKFVILLNDILSVTCKNEYERVLSVEENKIKGVVSFYPSFGWVKEKNVPFKQRLNLTFNDDARDYENTFVEFSFVDNNGKDISRILDIKVNGEPLQENIFRVTSEDESVELEFLFKDKNKVKKQQGFLRIVNHNIDRVGKKELSKGEEYDVLQYTIKYNRDWNPLALGVFWITVIFIVILLLVYIYMRIKYPRFGSIQKTINVPGMAPVIIRFKGAREVVVAASHPKKQSAWNRFWTGKIIYKTHPAFVTPITFKPSRGRRILVKVPAGAYQVLPNPMPGVGSATIIDIHKNLKITVN